MEFQESLTSFVPRTAWPVSSFLARRPQSLCNSSSRLRVKFAQCKAGRVISFEDIRQFRAVRVLVKIPLNPTLLVSVDTACRPDRVPACHDILPFRLLELFLLPSPATELLR